MPAFEAAVDQKTEGKRPRGRPRKNAKPTPDAGSSLDSTPMHTAAELSPSIQNRGGRPSKKKDNASVIPPTRNVLSNPVTSNNASYTKAPDHMRFGSKPIESPFASYLRQQAAEELRAKGGLTPQASIHNLINLFGDPLTGQVLSPVPVYQSIVTGTFIQTNDGRYFPAPGFPSPVQFQQVGHSGRPPSTATGHFGPGNVDRTASGLFEGGNSEGRQSLFDRNLWKSGSLPRPSDGQSIYYPARSYNPFDEIKAPGPSPFQGNSGFTGNVLSKGSNMCAAGGQNAMFGALMTPPIRGNVVGRSNTTLSGGSLTPNPGGLFGANAAADFKPFGGDS